MNAPRPYVAIFRPEGFSPHSGMEPVARELDAEFLTFAPGWEWLQKRSWTLGNALRQWGIRRYGSTWNALVPGWDEARFLRALPRRAEPYPVHFIWGEFGAPRNVAPYRRKGARVVDSVHCSACRWDSVWLRAGYKGGAYGGYGTADE